MLSGSKFRQPRSRRRDDELPAGIHEAGQSFETTGWFGEPVHQVGQQDDVELSQVIAWVQGIALLEAHPHTVNFLRHHGGRVSTQFALLGKAEIELPIQGETGGAFDEPLREIDAEDLPAMARQLKARSPNRTAEVQRARTGRQTVQVEAFADGANGKAQRRVRAEFKGQDLRGSAVMKQQVFAHRPVSFVKVLRHKLDQNSGHCRRIQPRSHQPVYWGFRWNAVGVSSQRTISARAILEISVAL